MAEIRDYSVAPDPQTAARWPEGMAMSAVNDTGRVDEGIVARWYRDTRGDLGSTGSANAYVVTPNRDFASVATGYDGLVLTFQANFTNTGAATLAAGAILATAIKNNSNGADLVGGEIAAGAKVTVIHNGTNWVLTESQTSSPFFSVVAFGAKGDGITDDTAAIQAAADAAAAVGGMVYVPAGTYVVSSKINLGDNVSFVGAGAASLIRFSGTFDIGIGNVDTINGNSQIYIANLRVDGDLTVNDPIELTKCSDSIIEKIWASRGQHDGIELEQCTNCIVANVICHDAVQFGGVEMDSCVHCIVVDSIAYNNGGSGFEIDGTSTNCHVLGCMSFNNTAHGFLMNASTSDNFVSGHAHNNTGFAVIDNGANNNSLIWRGGKLAVGGDDPPQRLSVHVKPTDGQSYAHFSNGETGQTISRGMDVGWDGSSSSAILWSRENSLLRLATNNAEVWRALGSYIYQSAPNAPPSDGDIPIGYLNVSVDEAGNNLRFRVRYSDGTTLKTGTVALV